MSTTEKIDRFPFKFNMTMTFEQRDAVDQWRAQQPGVPSRAEAVRRLIEKALNDSTPD